MHAAIAEIRIAPTLQPRVLLMVWREASAFLMVLRQDRQMRTRAAPPASADHTLRLHHLPNPPPRLRHPRALPHRSTGGHRRPAVPRPAPEMTAAQPGRMRGRGRRMVLSEGLMVLGLMVLSEGLMVLGLMVLSEGRSILMVLSEGRGRRMVLSEGRQGRLGGVLPRVRQLLLNGHASHVP